MPFIIPSVLAISQGSSRSIYWVTFHADTLSHIRVYLD
jgi:hypothetical protein